MKNCKKFLVLILSVLILSACSSKDGIKRIKIGHGLDQSHPVHIAMEYLAKRAAEKSNGQLKISVYPSQQLGTERECLELLQIGSLGMTKVSASVLEGFVPDFKVFSLPFVFKSDDHKFKFLKARKEKNCL